MAHDIFISYSRKDKIEAGILCDALKDAGISYWIDREEILAGADFTEKIADAIENAKILVFVSSRNSNHTEWVAKEVFYAFKNGKAVIPFNLDDEPYNSSVKLWLANLNFYPAYPPPIARYMEEFIQKIKDNLQISDHKPFFKRITDINDPDLLVLLEIYRSCFPVDKNVAGEFITANLTIFNEKHQAYLFVLKTNYKIIGIADVSYFPDFNRLFVSYIGVYHHKDSGDKLIYTTDIIEGLLDYFKNKNLVINDIVFETEEERVYRHFSRILKNRFSLTPYRLVMDYRQPEMVSDDQSGITKELPASLIYVPLTSGKHLKRMTKKQVINIINFIYFNIYIDITDRPAKVHKAYLDRLIQQYKDGLPEFIELED